MRRNLIFSVLVVAMAVVFLIQGTPVHAEEALKEGMSGDNVLKLQAKLHDLGYYQGALDASFGAGTRSALTSFQSANNLAADGVAGSATLAALNLAGASSGGDQLPLKTGSSGDMVLKLQAKLHELGYYEGSFDGLYGTGTSNAVAAFQSANQLTADGIAGTGTLNALQLLGSDASGGNNTSVPPNSNDNQPPYKEGMSGENVLNLQTRLHELGYYQGPLDGSYGRGTQSAVAVFQSDNYLLIDGVAGPATLTAMQSANTREAIVASRGQDVDRQGPAVVAFAKQFLGTPYVWAGNSASGFDCSGFTHYVYNNFGISLPRAADGQYNAGPRVSELQLGDLVFFSTYEAGPSHVGIYIGDNQFIHSSSGTGDVTITSLSASFYSERYLGACRVLR